MARLDGVGLKRSEGRGESVVEEGSESFCVLMWFVSVLVSEAINRASAARTVGSRTARAKGPFIIPDVDNVDVDADVGIVDDKFDEGRDETGGRRAWSEADVMCCNGPDVTKLGAKNGVITDNFPAIVSFEFLSPISRVGTCCGAWS